MGCESGSNHPFLYPSPSKGKEIGALSPIARNDADGIKFLAVDPNRDLANHAFNLRSVMNMQQRK